MVSATGKSHYAYIMKPVFDGNVSHYDGPATYWIRVEGRIAEGWADRLEGMTVTVRQDGDAAPISSLVGQLSDQGALTGVLNTLYELHLVVISVTRLD